MQFVSFMQNSAGRAIRIVAGAAIIAAGITIGGAVGVTLVAVGLVLLIAGMAKVCVFAPLFGLTLRGQHPTV